jgi:adenylate kinase
MFKIAVIIYGSPGAGKGTQANILAGKLEAIHFDTGRVIENKINSDEINNNLTLQKIKKIFDEGKLSPPDWVLNLVRRETERIARAGKGIVFSGSPRTTFEAFGEPEEESLSNMLEKSEEKVTSLMDTLVEEYGKENIFIFHLNISPETSIERNSKRVVYDNDGKPRKRTLDNPETIKIRLEEYKNRTLPILNRLKSEKYSVFEIDGEPSEQTVHQEIMQKLSE